MLPLLMDVSGKSGESVTSAQGRLLVQHHQWLEESKKCVGDPSLCKRFLLQSLLFFTNQGRMIDKKKVAKFINLHTGKVLKWALAVWEVQDETLSSFGHFLCLFHRPSSIAHNFSGETSSHWVCFGITYACHWNWMEWTSSESCLLSGTKRGDPDWDGMVACHNEKVSLDSTSNPPLHAHDPCCSSLPYQSSPCNNLILFKYKYGTRGQQGHCDLTEAPCTSAPTSTDKKGPSTGLQ